MHARGRSIDEGKTDEEPTLRIDRHRSKLVIVDRRPGSFGLGVHVARLGDECAVERTRPDLSTGQRIEGHDECVAAAPNVTGGPTSEQHSLRTELQLPRESSTAVPAV